MSQSQRAFTLLEMLVALAVALVMCVVLISMLAGTSRIWTLENQRAESFREARAALDFMANDLGKVRALADTTQTVPLLALMVHPETTGPDKVNEELYATLANPNSGLSDWCALGYYCAWSDQHTAWVLRRQFRESNSTFTRLNQVLASGGPPPPDAAFALLYDRPEKATEGSVDDLATYVWDLRFVLPAGMTVTGTQKLTWPQGAFSQKLPPWVEIRFKAISPLAGRRLAGAGVTRDDWFDPTSPHYRRLIGPYAQEFVTRVQFAL